ncbi:hypothetical protein [Winogradskyella sp. PE311]|uniref:hypothetical protein n=1 Tax=Winogradskyella sp. PE311 TaxID=3366943 RepID=UPI0039817691
MKNFVSLIIGIAIGAIAMYLYCTDDAEAANALGFTAPNGIIKAKGARTLDKAYNLKHSIINDSLFKKSTNGGDNRSSWWSVKDIQNYINYAENQAGELGYTMDGLRVYLGSYPDTKGQTGLTTMFFIPTGNKITSEGSILPTFQGGGTDIPGADGLNRGGHGQPPGANYPQ